MNNKEYTAPRTEWGKNCKSAMALKGITMKDLAKLTGYSYNYLSSIINGRVIPPIETIESISELLGVSVSEYTA